MNGEERYNLFLSNIDTWIGTEGVAKFEIRPEVEEAINMDTSDIRSLSPQKCLEMSYELYCYAEYLDSILAKQETALEWAEDSIMYIISDKLDQYGDKYTKWQEKYFRAVKENPLACEIIKVKNTASARVRILENKIQTIKKLSEVLTNLSKRK